MNRRHPEAAFQRQVARKYSNTPVVVDGYRFASKAEAKRYGELKLLEKAGKISGLTLQPRYKLEVHGMKICDYVGDFYYFTKTSHQVAEDVKGIRTPVYRLKKKLMKAIYGIDIVEIEA